MYNVTYAKGSTHLYNARRESKKIDDNGLMKQFMEFTTNEWNPDMVYTTGDFVKKYKITRHLARYYLFDKLVRQEKLLFRVMFYNKSYFIKRTPENIDMMSEFVWMGVKIDLK